MHVCNLTILMLCFLGTQPPAQKPQATPGNPDEPMAARMSLRKAAEYLDQTAVGWLRSRNCASCHSTYTYLMARPDLKEISGPAEAETRKFLENKAANWDT